MSIFDIYKDRIKKISDVKFLKEIKDTNNSEDKTLEMINTNNLLLKNIIKDYILEDFILWYEKEVNNGNSDRIKKLAEWLNIWNLYLQLEERFDSNKLRKYERGDIIHVNFGFNVCSELGGSHYAVVIEKNNDKSSETIIVVPLRSENGDLKELEVINKLNKHEILLGKNIISVGDAKGNYSIAKVNQARAIGKLRITAPRKDKDIVYPIDKLIRTDILNKIDLELKNLVIK